MARRTVVLVECEVHGEECPKGNELQEFKFTNPLTGEPMKADLCPSEIKARTKAIETLVKSISVDDDEKERIADEWEKKLDETFQRGIAEGESLAQVNRAPRKRGEPDPDQPLIDAAKAWQKVLTGKAPRGVPTRRSEFVQNFLNSPPGAPWRTWQPGEPIPGTLEAAAPSV